jgi:hypothetical protein
LAYAINKDGRYANLNHLEDFKGGDRWAIKDQVK